MTPNNNITCVALKQLACGAQEISKNISFEIAQTYTLSETHMHTLCVGEGCNYGATMKFRGVIYLKSH